MTIGGETETKANGIPSTRIFFDTGAKEPELQLLDVVVQALGDDRYTEEQRSRVLRYLNDRFGDG